MIKHIYFDVAGTLLHKPDFFIILESVLIERGFNIPMEELKFHHKVCSEIITFPDKTSKEFYQSFNKNFLLSIGIIPDEELLETIFTKCSYLPWEPFEDTNYINDLRIPSGIISNWDKSLTSKLKEYFSNEFAPIVGSADLGHKKPSLEIYHEAMNRVTPLTPREILYIGDSLKLDIIPAVKIGMQAILIDRDNIFKNYQGLKISCLSELANHLI